MVELIGIDDGDIEDTVVIVEWETGDLVTVGFVVRGVKDDRSFFTCGGVSLFVLGKGIYTLSHW